MSPLVAALNLIGDGWTFLILREAFFRVRRFEGMRGNLQIPRARLVERLTALVKGGVLVRQPYQHNPPRFEYRLSPMGRDIFQMTLLMKTWAEKWRTEKFPHLALHHRDCGEHLMPQLCCTACDTQIKPDSVVFPMDQPITCQGELLHKRRSLPADVYDRGTRREAVMETLKVIGDQWSIAILYEAFKGATYFEDFCTRTGIARNTLTLRLNHLVAESIFEKHKYQESSHRERYALTPAGTGLLPVVLAMEAWGACWLSEAPPQQPATVHADCGNSLQVKLVCKACHQPIDARHVVVDAN